MAELVSVDFQDDIATLTMDDGKANALSLAMSQAIGGALDHATKKAKAVILRGRPGVLCGGFDLKVIRGDDEDARRSMRVAGMELMQRLFLLPQPFVIACHGHSVAAGGLLLLTGDVRIGAKGDYKLGLNEVAIGLAMPVTGVELAQARLNRNALTDALILAKLYAPDEAASVGYLDKAVPADAVDSEARAAATRLMALDGEAFAETKRRLRQSTVERMII